MLTMTGLQETENASAAVVVSPNTRVRLDDIYANIAEQYWINGSVFAGDIPHGKSLSVLTVCVLVLKNGFTVIGKAAPADEQNFNAELGMKFAHEDAIRQCWPLMGYALREKLRNTNSP
jgi:hypothetical protein